MTDLVQRLRSLKEWAEEREIPNSAKAGAAATALTEILLNGAILITPEFREIIINDIGVPAYIGYLAVINVLGTAFVVGNTIMSYHGDKTNNNSYVNP